MSIAVDAQLRTDATGHATRTLRLRGAALVVAAAASIVAYSQFRAPFRWHEPYRPLRDVGWWQQPIEWNLDAGLPDIGAGVNAITTLGDTVWIAGNGGFLAFSDDVGRTWTKLDFDAGQRRFSLPEGVRVRTPPKSAAWNLADLIAPPVDAAAPSQAKAPSSQSPVQQTAPPPQRQSGSTKSDAPLQGARPLLLPSVDAMKFGEVPVGMSESLIITFKIQNPTAAGPVVDISVPNDTIFRGGERAFSIGSTDCDEISVKQACNMYVRFAPTEFKQYEAILGWWNVSLAVSGAGVRSPSSGRQASPKNEPRPPAAPQDAQTASPVNLFSFSRCTVTECEVVGLGEVGLADPHTFRTTDAGATWTDGPRSRGLALSSDSPTGWRLSAANLERSENGAWVPVTRTAAAVRPGHSPLTAGRRYGRLVPPWYLVVLLFCALLVQLEPSAVVVPARPKSESANDDAEIAGNHGTADKPLEPGQPDALGLSAIAAGLAIFLRNEDTKPPLVIAVNGRWGSGKSSLMNLLRGNLEKFGTRPVWFNAWHHQNEDQLLAALLQAVKMQAVPPLWSRGGWSFRARLAASRFERYWPQVALGVAALCVIWRAEPVVLRWLLQSAPDAVKADTTAPSISVKDVIGWLESKWLVTIATTTLTVWRGLSGGLRAFATDPASLLAAEAGGTTAKALQAQTSFRQEFATEFCDVTWALGKRRRMLILVDDLDRCRPEKVREVLEAVNFLVSSGELLRGPRHGPRDRRALRRSELSIRGRHDAVALFRHLACRHRSDDSGGRRRRHEGRSERGGGEAPRICAAVHGQADPDRAVASRADARAEETAV